jgi:hypothetical protein
MTKLQSAFNVYIGFGGAGCKVLAELAERIGQDFEASRKADMDYAFVLVDTDQGELGDSAAKIDRTLSSLVRRANLMVHQIPIGGPFTWGFAEEVAEMYDECRGKMKPEDFELLKKAWWTVEGREGEPERPLALAGVVNPKEGASQMPLSSHLMTFWNEVEIKRTVANLVDAYRIRFGDRAAGKQVNMYFVTSLAGGTGRGCWASFAYMFRQAFEEQGIQANPLGLFLDAGPFQDVFANQPDKLVQTQVNALTGFSELSMFLRNAFRSGGQNDLMQRSRKLEYLLPSLSGGVMARARFSQENDKGGPVDGALVIFRGNDAVPFLSDVRMYYEVAGQTLFMFLCDEEFRSKTWNNKSAGRSLYAVGASSAYVPSAELKDYVEDYKKAYFLRREVRSGKKSGDNGDAAKLRTNASPASLQAQISNANDANRFAQEVRDLLVAINAGKGRKLTDVGDLLNSVKPSINKGVEAWVDGRGAVNKVYKKGDSGQPKVDEELSEPGYFAKTLDARIPEAIVRSVMKRFLLSGNSGLSLEECIAVIRDIREDWKKAGEAKAAESPDASTKLMDEINRRASREGFLGLAGDRFSKDELNSIGGMAGTFYDDKVKAEAAKEVAKYAGGVVARLTEAGEALERFKQGLSSLAERVLSGSDPKDPKKKKRKHDCFATFDVEKKPQLLLPDARFGQDVRINFKLRPIKTADDEARLAAAIEDQWADPADPESVLFKPSLDKAKMALFAAIAAEAGEAGNFAGLEGAKASVLKTFESALGVIRCIPQFVEENYSLEKVLRQYAELIPQVYRKLKTEDQLDFAEQAFKIFGIQDPAVQSSVSEMAAGLAAFITVNCHPFARFKQTRGKKVVTDVSVLIPSLDDKSADDLEGLFFASPTAKEHGYQKVKRVGERGVTLRKWDGKAFAINAFCASAPEELLDLESENLGFSSLDYWKEGSQKEQLGQLLSAAEDTGSGNLAYGHTLMLNGGIGYIDPRFVRDEEWARLRWKPWAPPPKSATARELESQADAQILAYLCLGNFRPVELRGKAETSALATLDKLRALEFETKPWVLPVLAKDTDGFGWVWQRLVYKSPGHEVTQLLCKSWKRGGKLKNLGNMIDAAKKIRVEDKEKIRKEIEMLQVLLKGEELDLSEREIKSLQHCVREFLMWLQANEADNFADKPEKKAEIEAMLDAAANAADSLFVPIKH